MFDPIPPEGQTHPLASVKKHSGGNLETHYLPLYFITGFFAVVFFIVPLFIPKGPDRWTYKACVMMTAFSLWIFWVTIYVAQMNPLVGPRVTNVTLAWIAHCWKSDLVNKEDISQTQEKLERCQGTPGWNEVSFD